LVDPGDFKTAETGLTVTGLSVQIYQTKNDGTAVVRTQITPSASGGSNDMALVTDSTDGMYDLELTAAQLNWLGNGRITFYDVDGFIVHWIDIQVVSAPYFDWIFGTTIPDVNVTKVNGTSQTAKDLGASITQTGDVYAKLPTNFEDMAITNTTGLVSANIVSQDNIDFGALQKASITAAVPTVDQIHDEVVEGTLTFRKIMKLLLAFAAGKSTGGGTETITFKDNADSKPRITATADANGNRTAVTLDGD
jgi:hypothetical protein